MVFEAKTPEAFQDLFKKFSRGLPLRALLLFDGDLGAGKTLAIRSIVEARGGVNPSSPSFAIIQQYPTPKGPVIHVDLYRLKDESDLESTGFWDLFDQPQGLICIEWANRLPAASLPTAWPQIHIQIQKMLPEGRKLLITSSGAGA